MQSSNEKEEEIPTTNYKILNTILTEKKIPKTIKKVFLISTFLISLILLIIQTQKIKKVKEKNQNLLLINKNLSQIFSPKVIPYKSKNHLDSIIDNVFYPYKSDIIETMEDLNFLRETLGKVGLRLEYKAKIHGDNVVKFQEKTKTHHHLLLIKTKKVILFFIFIYLLIKIIVIKIKFINNKNNIFQIFILLLLKSLNSLFSIIPFFLSSDFFFDFAIEKLS